MGQDAGHATMGDGAHAATRDGGHDARRDVNVVDARYLGPETRVRDAGADAWSFRATTTTTALTQNNTSACGSSAAPCSGAWDQTETVQYGTGSSYAGAQRTVTAFWDHAVPAGPRASGSADGYVSKVPMSALLPTYDVPIWVETQNWWGDGSGHIDNGEVSTDATQIQDQIADHLSRGIAGQVVDWYGPGTTADKALPFIRSSAEAAGSKYEFAVMIDKGYFTSCGVTVACLNSAIAYIVQQYAGSSAYLSDDGRPLIFFFINSYYPSEYAVLQSTGIDYQGTEFVMYEPNGFSGNDPPNTMGEYAWVNPADGTDTSTTGDAGTFPTAADYGFKDMTSFFGAAKDNASAYAVSEAHKGFDDNLANWSLNRIIDQACGQTWLQTFDHTGSFAGSATYVGSLNYLASGGHLDFVMVDTWDDYEEGTEMETGIDNCLASLDATLSGSMLTWAPTWGQDPMNAAITGSEATVYKYSVYLAEPGSSSLMWLSDVPCAGGTCGHSLDVSTLGITGGPYVFYVQAVGFPSIVNTLSTVTSATYGG
jgi:hypothetical protein